MILLLFYDWCIFPYLSIIAQNFFCTAFAIYKVRAIDRFQPFSEEIDYERNYSEDFKFEARRKVFPVNSM